VDVNGDDLSIRTLIQAVTRELLESQAERLAAGGPAVFEVKDLTLEISFVATSSKHGGGGFDLKVVKADAGVQYDKQSVHKIQLTLTAVDFQPVAEPSPLPHPVRPR
jgi:Trypsin-co-occurring domain 2